MATLSACTTLTEPSSSLWTVEQIKIYLKEKELPVSGRKNELVKRVVDFQEAEALQAEIGTVAFQNLSIPAVLPLRACRTVAGVSVSCLKSQKSGLSCT